MTEQDRDQFAEVMAVLASIFEKQLSTTLVEAYFSALNGLSIEQIRTAANLIVRNSRFFPKPAEFYELAQGNTEDQAAQAWALLLRTLSQVGSYRSLYVTDGTMAAAIRETWGGWLRCCDVLRDCEGPMLANQQKQFLSQYKIASRGDARAQYFPGISEASNRQNSATISNRINYQLPPKEDGDDTEVELPEITFKQQIGVIESGDVFLIEVEFSASTGALTESERRRLESGQPLRLTTDAPRLLQPIVESKEVH